MAIIWPSELPQKPEKQGYSEEFSNTVIRTSMEAGVDKLRRRYTAGTKNYTFTYYLTDSQVTVLDDFYTNSCAGGALRFTMNHPRTNVSKEWRFKNVPKPSLVGYNLYSVTLNLEEMP